MHCQRCGNQTRTEERDGKARPVCPVCGFVVYLDPKLAVAVLIQREGRLLLGKRGEGTREPGKWSFPAGFVERGEQVEHAAAREAWEETGLSVQIGRLIGVFSSPGETVVLVVYEATGDGVPVAADDLVEIGWFDPNALPELAFEHDIEIVERWRALGAGN